MKKSRVLHLSTLISKGACRSQVEKFKELFGESVIVTPAKAKKMARVFEWNWAAHNLLSAPARKAYDEAKALSFATLYINDKGN